MLLQTLAFAVSYLLLVKLVSTAYDVDSYMLFLLRHCLHRDTSVGAEWDSQSACALQHTTAFIVGPHADMHWCVQRKWAVATESAFLERKEPDRLVHASIIDPKDIVVCTKGSGEDWLLGAGSFGTVSDCLCLLPAHVCLCPTRLCCLLPAVALHLLASSAASCNTLANLVPPMTSVYRLAWHSLMLTCITLHSQFAHVYLPQHLCLFTCC